jgi:hypothetical protein
MGQMPEIDSGVVPAPYVEVVCDEETGQFKIHIALLLRTGLAAPYPQTYFFENVPRLLPDDSGGSGPYGSWWDPAPNLMVDENGYLVGTVDLSLSPRWQYPPSAPPIPPPASVQGITWNCTVHFYPPAELLQATLAVAPDVDAASPEAMDSASPQPTTVQKATTYATAVARWIAAGFPIRSDEEVERIYEICSACKWMHAAGYCQKCGCRLSKSRQAMTNKIRMATEHCPLPDQKW